MKTIRKNGNSDPTSLQPQRLAGWLKEWELDRILRKEPASDHGQPMPRFAQPHAGGRFPCGNVPAVGEIRLLHPAGANFDQGPVYIAVLEARSDNTFLIAPFGRFAEPALPGEWLTRLKTLPLRVLCLWNSRTIAGSRLLAMSWSAGRLTGRKIKEALEVHNHMRTGAPLVSVLPADIGPPLLHPLDPRHQYQQEESDLLETSLAQGAPGSERLVYETNDDEVRLAAEPTDLYGGKSNSRRRRKPRK